MAKSIPRSFCLIKKNQKIKAYTPEATNWGVPLKSRKTRFAQTPRFLHAPHPNLLHASCVRPVLLFHVTLSAVEGSLHVTSAESHSPFLTSEGFIPFDHFVDILHNIFACTPVPSHICHVDYMVTRLFPCFSQHLTLIKAK